jgi:NAD(P)-dependent dehydrogenase (short-subunit alcohol dehydrogenase family)
MSKTIIVVGFGPGISTAVANKFGEKGFNVALVARSEDRLTAGVSDLKANGIMAMATPADAGDPDAIRRAINKVRAEFGSITVILWNAFGGLEAGDILAVDSDTLRRVFDVAVVGLISAVKEALPDLRADGGAILVTNGAAGDINTQMDDFVTNQHKIMGVALANGAKHKLVGLLSQRLKADGIYVGEVMIAGAIKGTPTGDDNSIESATVANMFWDLYQMRGEIRGRITDPRF